MMVLWGSNEGFCVKSKGRKKPNLHKGGDIHQNNQIEYDNSKKEKVAWRNQGRPEALGEKAGLALTRRQMSMAFASGKRSLSKVGLRKQGKFRPRKLQRPEWFVTILDRPGRCKKKGTEGAESFKHYLEAESGGTK